MALAYLFLFSGKLDHVVSCGCVFGQTRFQSLFNTAVIYILIYIYIYIGQCERWAREKANGKGEGKITL